MRIVTIVAAALLATAGSAQAAEYMFSLSWEPTFCASRQGKQECQTLKPESYDARHLVLHGLWPQGRQYCGVSKDIVALDQNNQTWEQLPAVEVSAATRDRMATLFPGVVSYLDRHEWVKHGTCSGLTPDAYFTLALDLVEQANAKAFGRLIGDNAGKSVSVGELCGALGGDFGADYAKAAIVKQSGDELSEVRFALRDTDQPLALDGAHLSPGKRVMPCTGTLAIPAPKPNS